MSTNTFILGGRFQPFHNDHMRLVDRFFEMHPDEHLVLAIIRPADLSLLGEDRFREVSQEHFADERNPLSPTQVRTMIGRVVVALGDRSVSMTLLPRLAKGPVWSLITGLLPGPRTWLVPARGERWDEEKAAFIEEMGDTVLRIDCPRGTSGFDIRNAIRNRRLQEIRDHVPTFLGPQLIAWFSESTRHD